jgi:hypothetical protein
MNPERSISLDISISIAEARSSLNSAGRELIAVINKTTHSNWNPDLPDPLKQQKFDLPDPMSKRISAESLAQGDW